MLKRVTRLSEDCLRTVAQRVLLGLLNMKTSAGLHHVDIKPHNIGLLRDLAADRDYRSTVILDFGSALPLGAHLPRPRTTLVPWKPACCAEYYLLTRRGTCGSLSSRKAERVMVLLTKHYS